MAPVHHNLSHILDLHSAWRGGYGLPDKPFCQTREGVPLVCARLSPTGLLHLDIDILIAKELFHSNPFAQSID